MNTTDLTSYQDIQIHKPKIEWEEAERNIDKIVDKRYKIKGVLGEGGQAIVWDGYDTKTNRPVALKQLKKHHMHSGNFTICICNTNVLPGEYLPLA